MKAIICTAYGPPEVLELADLPVPEPKRGEVRIRMRATAATYSDCMIRGLAVKGMIGFVARTILGRHRPRRSVLGIVVSGDVDCVGRGVRDFKAGQQVFGMDRWKAGAYAEYKCMKASSLLVPKPANLTHAEAAALPYGALLALSFLRRGNIDSGMRVLIYGASGATGSAAVQLAKHLGAHVTGVCSTANLGLVKSLGADVVIDYTEDDFTRSNERYDLVFAAVGKRYGPPVEQQCRSVLSRNGSYVSIDDWNPRINREMMLEIAKLAESGALRPVIDHTYPLAEMAEAHRRVETRRKRGNVVIEIA